MKVVLVMVQTIDGKIANDIHKSSLKWSSREDTHHFVVTTKEIGTIIMGSKTYDSYGGKVLKNRRNIIMTRSPEKYNSNKDVEFFSGLPAELVEKLESEGLGSVVLAGGASLNTSFLKAGLVDEIYLTVEPLIFGKGINFVASEELDVKCELIEVKNLNQSTLLLHYKVIR